LLVFDEVVSGLRLGLSGAAGRFGVTPDLATYGKAIGSGFAVSAVAGRGDVVDLVTRGAIHGGTFNGNPLSMAALLATLDTLSGPGVYDRIDEAGQVLTDGVRAAAAAAGHVVATHSLGATTIMAPGLTAITGPDDYVGADWQHWNEVVVPAMLARGVYLLPGGRLFLSTEHGRAEVAETVAAFTAVFNEIPAPRIPAIAG
jgi:glutamate-1-semialdehyde 2,1-aminomutase